MRVNLQPTGDMPPASAVLGLWAVLLFAVPVQGQFSAVPGVVRLSASATSDAAVVHVRNEGERTLQFRIYAGDYDQGENGDYAVQPFGANARSCEGKLSFFPDNTVLSPGEGQEVQVRMEGGDACWSLLFIEAAADEDARVRIAERIGVRVLNVPPGLAFEGEVVYVEAVHHDSLDIDVAFHNTGSAPVELHGAVEIRRLEGDVAARADIGPFGVLPEHVRRIRVLLPGDLPAGQYLAVPVLDFGGDYLAGGQVMFTVR